MKRKDCDNKNRASRRRVPQRLGRRGQPVAAAMALATVLCVPVEVIAGSVRLWPSAVVVDDHVRLSDLCELGGFDRSIDQTLRNLVVAQAPPAGGTRLIHLEMIRSALAAGGANMATVTMGGATQCAVSHPADLEGEYPEGGGRSRDGGTERQSLSVAPMAEVGSGSGVTFAEASHTTGNLPAGVVESASRPVRHPDRLGNRSPGPPAERSTLRRAVVDHFSAECARYRGTADVIFDQTSAQILDLASPPYEFRVRRRGGSALGMTPLEVDVIADGRAVQTVPLVVQVALIRRVVMARRSINQGATIRAVDLGLTEMSFTRLDKLGVDDVSQAIGQRCKRFVPAGTLIVASMLESVPLVQRGQLVTLTSELGGIKVTTTAKAAETGLLGEVITVRAVDNKRVEFDGVVIGPGAVRIGLGSMGAGNTRIVMGQTP